MIWTFSVMACWFIWFSFIDSRRIHLFPSFFKLSQFTNSSCIFDVACRYWEEKRIRMSDCIEEWWVLPSLSQLHSLIDIILYAGFDKINKCEQNSKLSSKLLGGLCSLRFSHFIIIGIVLLAAITHGLILDAFTSPLPSLTNTLVSYSTRHI